jgi:hypothetical protein
MEVIGSIELKRKATIQMFSFWERYLIFAGMAEWKGRALVQGIAPVIGPESSATPTSRITVFMPWQSLSAITS